MRRYDLSLKVAYPLPATFGLAAQEDCINHSLMADIHAWSALSGSAKGLFVIHLILDASFHDGIHIILYVSSQVTFAYRLLLLT